MMKGRFSKSYFKDSLAFSLRWEGGYSDHPADRGGATNKGITQATFDNWNRMHGLSLKPVKFISNSEVREIYRYAYWGKIWGDKVAKIDKRLATAMLDFAINSGVMRAVQYLQRILNDKVKDDGVMGEKTYQAIKKEKNIEDIIKVYLIARRNFLKIIGKGTQRVFLKGWMNRMDSLEEFLGL